MYLYANPFSRLTNIKIKIFIELECVRCEDTY